MFSEPSNIGQNPNFGKHFHQLTPKQNYAKFEVDVTTNNPKPKL